MQFTLLEQQVGREFAVAAASAAAVVVAVVVGRVPRSGRQPIHNIYAIHQGARSQSAQTRFGN